MRILGLCNPSSGGKPERLEDLQRLAQALSTTSSPMTLAATHHAVDAEQALAEAQLGAGDILLVSGGDGTIQHALSWLLHGGNPPGGRVNEQPTVALLPAGSTNMTAIDINSHRDWQQCLATFRAHIDRSQSLPLRRRPLVSVRDGDITRAGFFVGGGAIVRGIEYCNKVLWANGAARKERTAGLAMLRTIWGVLRRQPPFDEVDALSVSAMMADGTIHTLNPRQGALLFATSTLERLIVGVRPFWGEAPDEPMPYVLVERDAKLIRNLPGLLGVSGFRRPVAGRGFHSHNCTGLELQMESAYAIDGELFVPNTGILGVSLSESLEFLEL